MPLRPDELERHLRSKLAPVYLIAGEEPLFVQEALDAVRAAARASGCTEREVLDVESGFDWNRLLDAAGNLSLFGDRRLIELRMPTGKPGAPGAKAIAAFCESAPTDVVLLVSCGALDAAQRKSAWVGALERAGVFVYGWSLSVEKLPGWVAQRLRRRGLSAPEEAVALLAERAEGNLLAGAQEIEKLHLLYGGGALSFEQVAEAVSDSARYTPYDLADAALDGNVARAVRIVRGLRQEGAEPTLVLWALARDLRVLADIAGHRAVDEVWRAHKVWKTRQGRLQQVARRGSGAAWAALLGRAARVDRVIKGLEPGRAWDELLQLATAAARRGLQEKRT